jgi:hypothetical protein
MAQHLSVEVLNSIPVVLYPDTLYVVVEDGFYAVYTTDSQGRYENKIGMLGGLSENPHLTITTTEEGA